MKLRLIISPVVVLLSLAICSSSVGQKPTGRPVNSTEPQPLTSLPKSVLDAELKAPSGGSFEIADYSGKVMVLNLGATWCGPCRLQVASLVKFHDQFRAQVVEVIG
jgi:thiol-disulfide isomerase/thioredoxin